MEITEVKIRLWDSPTLIALATIVIDNSIAINDIKVIKRGNENFLIKFPNHPEAIAHGKHNIVPLTNEVRLQIHNAIIGKLKQEKEGI